MREHALAAVMPELMRTPQEQKHAPHRQPEPPSHTSHTSPRGPLQPPQLLLHQPELLQHSQPPKLPLHPLWQNGERHASDSQVTYTARREIYSCDQRRRAQAHASLRRKPFSCLQASDHQLSARAA